MEYKDYYKVLGISKDASKAEIKRAYKKMARKYHPDVSKEADAEAHFKDVGEAYEVLKDPEKRAAYDQLGANWQSGQNFNPPPDWDAGFEFHGGGYTSDGGTGAEDFSDFFSSLFGQRAYQAPPGSQYGAGYASQGEDSHAKVLIDLEDAYHGASRSLTLRSTQLDEMGRPQLKERTLNVKIPKGVKQGQHIRLKGQGSPGIGGGKAGDLYLEIEFNPHSLYHVEGHDVTLDLPISPSEAVLGGSIKVPTPNGAVDMKIPPGSSSGKKLRLKGRGIPSRTPGDFYVTLKIVVPKTSSDEVRALYQKLADIETFNPRAGMGV
ncbi:MAG TPA: J domain-containing protein [Gammaproteobacteria bacterium]|nr:J domain-containing protein [Gammaproteobacteria bacterium]